jgi:hypothetical protein
MALPGGGGARLTVVAPVRHATMLHLPAAGVGFTTPGRHGEYLADVGLIVLEMCASSKNKNKNMKIH